MPLRVGLLGCGRIAAMFHAPVLARLPGVEVRAISDTAPEARDRVGAHVPGAVRFASWQSALDVAELDAVVICLPPAMHAPAALAAFAAGLHVYVEKPLALDLAEADRMVAAWRGSGRVGMVGLNFRHNPLAAAARARCQAGELGRIVAVRSMLTSARRALPGWKADPRAGGGALADLGSHHLDLIPFLAGEAIDPASVQAIERRTAEGSMAVVNAALGQGGLVQMLVAQTSGDGSHVVELLGEKGHLTVDIAADAAPRAIDVPAGRLARVRRLADRLRLLTPRELLHAPGREPSFERALAAFADAARAERQATPDLDDGRRALALVLRAEAAAGTAAPTLRAAG